MALARGGAPYAALGVTAPPTVVQVATPLARLVVLLAGGACLGGLLGAVIARPTTGGGRALGAHGYRAVRRAGAAAGVWAVGALVRGRAHRAGRDRRRRPRARGPGRVPHRRRRARGARRLPRGRGARGRGVGAVPGDAVVAHRGGRAAARRARRRRPGGHRAGRERRRRARPRHRRRRARGRRGRGVVRPARARGTGPRPGPRGGRPCAPRGAGRRRRRGGRHRRRRGGPRARGLAHRRPRPARARPAGAARGRRGGATTGARAPRRRRRRRCPARRRTGPGPRVPDDHPGHAARLLARRPHRARAARTRAAERAVGRGRPRPRGGVPRRCAAAPSTRRRLAARTDRRVARRVRAPALGDELRARIPRDGDVQRAHGRPHAAVDAGPGPAGARRSGDARAARPAFDTRRSSRLAPLAARRPARAGADPPARVTRAVRRLVHRAVLLAALRAGAAVPLGAPADVQPLPAHRRALLLADHRRRPRAPADAAPRPAGTAARGDAVPRVLRRRADGRRHRDRRAVLPPARPAVGAGPARRPAPRRRHRLGVGRGPAARGGHRAARTVVARRPARRDPPRPARRPRRRRRVSRRGTRCSPTSPAAAERPSRPAGNRRAPRRDRTCGRREGRRHQTRGGTPGWPRARSAPHRRSARRPGRR